MARQSVHRFVTEYRAQVLMQYQIWSSRGYYGCREFLLHHSHEVRGNNSVSGSQFKPSMTSGDREVN